MHVCVCLCVCLCVCVCVYVSVCRYDEPRHTTEFAILDARDVGKGPVARIRLPSEYRLPYAFHGSFTPEVFVHPRPKL